MNAVYRIKNKMFFKFFILFTLNKFFKTKIYVNLLLNRLMRVVSLYQYLTFDLMFKFTVIGFAQNKVIIFGKFWCPIM